jgi:adenine-specific DNA-methyltransferase
MVKTNYSEWDKSDLIKEIEKLEKRKKYGIVWEEKSEIVTESCKKMLPVLIENKTNEIFTGKDELNHILIEGDNYHSLSVLNYTHKKKVDVIYIDPPYNTGNRGWKFNNDYVEKDDDFKHSKWISFIDKRLRLAKNLLKPSGVIVVTIDDYEIHTLRLLMDEIFGESNRLGTITVVHNPRGRNDDKYFATMHEYMLVYAKNSDLASVGYFELTENDIDSFNKDDEISKYSLTSFMRTGNNSDRHTRPNLYYSIFYDPKNNELNLEKTKNSIELLPINNANEEKTWRWGQKTFLEKKDTELVIKKVKEEYKIYKKRRIIHLKGKKPRTIWYDPRYDASSHGIMLLQNMFGTKNVFPYPKSIWSNYDILKLLTKKKSIILDFFAGSGTVGHAVSLLNKEDNGSRKFILCTNNEGNICTEVCYPRIKKSILGYKDKKGKKIDGLGGNLKYFKTDFVDSLLTDRNKKKLVGNCTEMLCLREDCFEAVKSSKFFKIFTNNKKYLGIIYDDEGIEPFKKELIKINQKISTYVFSLDESAREEEFEDVIELVDLLPIPEVILNIYRRIFR